MFGLVNRKGGSPLEYVLLLLLRGRKLHGYELIGQLNALFGDLWKATTGTVYPVLSKMRKKELVSEEIRKSPIGPVKKVYRLAPKGELLLHQTLRDVILPEIAFVGRYVDLVDSIVDFQVPFDPLIDLLEVFIGAHLQSPSNGEEHPPSGEGHERRSNHFRQLLPFFLSELEL
ncbi:MAG: PadR family transcriptional regulator [Promethearchaeota archaeon]